jgi:plasmid maintenance system killer protein
LHPWRGSTYELAENQKSYGANASRRTIVLCALLLATALSDDLQGFHSVRINEQRRIILELKEGG